MIIEKYSNFIKISKKNESSNIDSPEFKDIKKFVKGVLDEHIEKTGADLTEFRESYLENPINFQIVGLSDPSDIWEFYLTYRNECDKILLENDFYDKAPKDLNINSLYDYVIEGGKMVTFYIIRGLDKY